MSATSGAFAGLGPRWAGLWGLLLAILMVAGLPGGAVQAHAIIEHAVPEANGVVAGPDVDIQLHYNSRIDIDRSRLSLARPDGTVTPLAVRRLPDDPAALGAQATGLANGAYVLHWQALAVDGHLTRGVIPFTVGSPAADKR